MDICIHEACYMWHSGIVVLLCFLATQSSSEKVQQSLHGLAVSLQSPQPLLAPLSPCNGHAHPLLASSGTSFHLLPSIQTGCLQADLALCVQLPHSQLREDMFSMLTRGWSCLRHIKTLCWRVSLWRFSLVTNCSFWAWDSGKEKGFCLSDAMIKYTAR